MSQTKPYYVHSHALCESEKIGVGTRVWAFVHVLPQAVIGNNCNICDHCFIENDVIIGDNVTVKSGIYIWDGARIGNNVFLGPNVVFTNDLRPRSKQYQNEVGQIVIEEGASIGANATLVSGIRIGKYAMVGAGSVVTRDVPAYGLVYGNPARQHGWVNERGEKVETRAD